MLAIVSSKVNARALAVDQQHPVTSKDANVNLKRLIDESGVASIVFSAQGIREGCVFDRLPEEMKAEDPLIAACRNVAWMTGRAAADGETLYHWMTPAFPNETGRGARLRRAACLLADSVATTVRSLECISACSRQ